MGAPEFLKALTVVLCVAAVTTVLFQRLRQPVILGYLLAGLIIGPHVPIPLVASEQIVRTLSELGVILLMFSLGLEFSLRKLFRVGPTAGLAAVIETSLMVWLGFSVARLLGWTLRESIFTGGIVAISSTTIIAKAFGEQKVRGRLREFVVGVLVVEDLIAILFMATLTAIASGAGLSPVDLALTTTRLAAFLITLVAVGLLIIPRVVRAITRLNRPETTLVSSVGICFAIALLAHEFGYSVALGAFIAGSLVAESGRQKQIEELVTPVRDIFAAIFFVSVGMQIDPSAVAEHGFAVSALTVTVLLGKFLGVSLGAFLTGNGILTSVQAGMSLAQIGEFSFIIAALGISLKATGEFLYPVAVAVSAVTTLTTPWLIRAAGPVATAIDRRLPNRLQTFAALYGSWLEQIRSAPPQTGVGSSVRRLLRLLLVDALLLGALLIGAAMSVGRIGAFLERRVGLDPSVAQALTALGTAVIAVPFCVGIVRLSRELGVVLAGVALPAAGAGRVDLALAPRRALIVTLQLAVVLVVGTPLVALTQPFVPDYPVAVVLLLALAALGFGFWRSATNLQGHVRAGAQVIVETLAAQSRTHTDPTHALDQVHRVLPGIGEPVPVEVTPTSPVVGKTLAEVNLRSLTGATVLAITRGEEGMLFPNAGEVLRVGDVLTIAGSHEAVDAARSLLLSTESAKGQ